MVKRFIGVVTPYCRSYGAKKCPKGRIDQIKYACKVAISEKKMLILH